MIRLKKLLLLMTAVVLADMAVASDRLWQTFLKPQQEARTKLWWFHGETVTTREGIDADLAAYKAAGIGGVVYYDQTHGTEQGAFPAFSQPWWDMLKYAALRAKELGLSFEIAASNGYVTGGPWVTPEMSMKEIVVLRDGDRVPKGFREITRLTFPQGLDTCIQRSRLTLKDNAPATIVFDGGKAREVRSLSLMLTPRGKGSYGSMNVPGKPQEHHFGAGYVLMPPVGKLECSDDGVTWRTVTTVRGVEDIIGHKSRQRTQNFKPVKARFFRLNIHDWLGPKSKYTKLEVENVRLMGYDMLDNWEQKSGLRSEVTATLSPRGKHRAGSGGATYRIGYAPTGGHAKHGRSNIVWNGELRTAKTWMESDVLSAAAVEHHYRSYIKPIVDTLTAIGCKPQGVCMDSHEAGVANWTERMPEHFRRLRGYDLAPWIPALGGVIVESREKTETFLADYRRTIEELISEQYYGTMARLCHEDGLTLTSQAMLGCVNDNIASRGMVDKPQGEFWAYQTNGNYDCLDAASAAHLYGKKIASGEAFTDSPYFTKGTTDEAEATAGWHKLLRIANLAYCRGINEFVVCASSYQPWMDRKYDDSRSQHPYIFHRHNPAWPWSREHFWEYQARCAQLLQTGRPVVDLLVYVGQDAPLKTMAYKLPVMPEGYCFDVCTLRSLKAWKENRNSLYAPDYKVLVVQDRTWITPEAEALFEEMESLGMLVVRCDKGEDVGAALAAAGLKPDMKIVSRDEADDKTYFCHRKTDDADIYFVYNHSNHDTENPLELRGEVRGMELWNPLTGERRKPENGKLRLRPYESVFVIAKGKDVIDSIKAPFPMAQLKRNVFKERRTKVEGLRANATKRNTTLVQRAIDRTADDGGGWVVVPAGDWSVARITLKSGVNLHLEEGCNLHFSGMIKDYQPAVFTRDEGTEVYSTGAFIYARGERNIALTGKGHIVGPDTGCELYQTNVPGQANAEVAVKKGEPVESRVFDGNKKNRGGAVLLPKSFCAIDCSNVLLEGVTFDRSLYWNINPIYCDSVIIRDVSVYSYGHGRTDGIDIESSRNVLIEYCTLDCQDDCYTLKSGRGWDGLRVNRPTENVVVRNCVALRGAAGFVTGTETAGGIRNVYCTDCTFDGTDRAIRFKSRRTRGGLQERIWVDNVKGRNIKHSAICVEMPGDSRWMGKLAARHPDMTDSVVAASLTKENTPAIRSIYINNVDIESEKVLFDVVALSESKLKDFFVGDSRFACKTIGRLRDVAQCNLKDLRIESADTALVVDGCEKISVFRMNKAVVERGEPSKMVVVHDPMLDSDGKPIQAHAFQIVRRDSLYYWYGENKEKTIPGSNVSTYGVRCYTSKDFEHWDDRGLIMTPDTTDVTSYIHYSQKLERPHILQSPKSGKFVLWLKSQDTDGYFVVMEADDFMGPYRFVRAIKPHGFGVGDFDMWCDPQTGKGYVWFERPHYEMICATLTDDFLDVTDEYSSHFTGLLPPLTREAPTHFVKDGVHYMFTSGTTGYIPNPSQVHRFTDPHGTYETLGDPHVGDPWQHSFGSQITSVVRKPDGSYWALADVWQPVTNNTDYAIRTAKAKTKAYVGHQPFPQDFTTPVPKDKSRQTRNCNDAVYNATYLFLPIDFSDPALPVMRSSL